VATFDPRPGRDQLQIDCDRFPNVEPGDHYGRCLGELCLGKLLELGSQRDLVPHYLVCLCSLLACSIYKRLEGKKGSHSVDCWICRSLIYVFWRELYYFGAS